MRVRVGLENGIEGRSLAWALDYPGCFSYGKDGTEALLNLPEALVRYKNWVDNRMPNSWMADLGDFDVHLDEVFECYSIDESYNLVVEGIEINAFFRDDWKPLTSLDIERGAQLMAWSREELLELITAVPSDVMDLEHEGELWPIRGIIRHIANGEHWYLSRLSLEGMPRASLPEDVMERLSVVRDRVNEVFPQMAGDKTVVGIKGEIWSPRKFMRRLLWHEMDHIQHIHKLAFQKP